MKTPVFGILCRGGQVWAQVVPDLAVNTLFPLIGRHVRRGSVVCTDALRLYTGIAAKGYVHRLVQHDQGEFRSRHVAEYVWRYNHRRSSTTQQVQRLLQLLKR